MADQNNAIIEQGILMDAALSDDRAAISVHGGTEGGFLIKFQVPESDTANIKELISLARTPLVLWVWKGTKKALAVEVASRIKNGRIRKKGKDA